MGIRAVWRHYWAQRSRPRVALARLCVVGTLLAVGLIYVPAAWLEQAGAALQAAGGYLASFGSRSLLFAAGGVLLVGAVLLIVLPRRRPHPYWVGRSRALPNVAVYLDLENQLSNAELRPFMGLLRQRLDGRRADLYYFTDASRQAAGKMYQEIWRFGFRPVDVPHKHLGVTNVKNIVDVELSLFAYERALLGPAHQDIILIAADQDYLPLIYRLSALGHRVAVWGRTVPDSYKSLQTYLDIEVCEFGGIITHARPSPPSTKSHESPPQSPRAGRAAHREAPVIPIAAPGALLIAMQATHDLALRIAGLNASVEQRMSAFQSQFGAFASTYLRPIGYVGTSRTICWLEVLYALDVLAIPSHGDAPHVTSGDIGLAVRTFEVFLGEIVREAVALVASTPEATIRYVDLAKAMSLRETIAFSPQSAALLQLVSAAHLHRIAHTRYCCLCARALGLLRFDEVIPGTSFRLGPSLTEAVPTPVLSDQPEPGTPTATS